MGATQWTVTALGLFAAMLGFCLLAIHAHESRRRRWIVFGCCAAALLTATVVFGLTVSPEVRAG